jgi:hypothetical protein
MIATVIQDSWPKYNLSIFNQQACLTRIQNDLTLNRTQEAGDQPPEILHGRQGCSEGVASTVIPPTSPAGRASHLQNY